MLTGNTGEFLEEPSHRNDGFAAVRTFCGDDVCPVPGLLHSARPSEAHVLTIEERRAARVLRLV